jgi:hypothetical protein
VVQVFVNRYIVFTQTTLTNLPTGVALGAGLAMKLGATAPTTAYAQTDYLFAGQDRSY